ncbi:RNA-binding domain-containing protein [Backusella circina FSU 941]|nr:RNA-binding domain-containing protein [Backusella circina FSU 941]
MNPPGDYSDPEPQSSLLFIKNLPSQTTNNTLYDLFRPFGPMNLCKIIIEPGTGVNKGTALIQYFYLSSAEDAETTMVNLLIYGMRTMTNNLIPPPPQPQQPPPLVKSESLVDYTNLYIKNLDLSVKSADLFNHFRRYGRIISARVMKNAQTRQSKGFGFVSFSKADEAIMAKEEMNGVMIMSKPIIIAFHEPKKPRDTNANNTATSGVTSSSPSSIVVPQHNRLNYNHHQRPPISPPIVQPSHMINRPSPPPPSLPSFEPASSLNTATTSTSSFEPHFNGYYHSNNTNNNGKPREIDSRYTNSISTYSSMHHQPQQQQDYLPFHNNISSNNISTSYPMDRTSYSHHSHIYDSGGGGPRSYSQLHIPKEYPLKRQLSHPGQQQTPSLSTLASGAFVHHPPPQQYHPPVYASRPTLRRRGSVESSASAMTETSSHTRRQTVTKAVMALDGSEKNVNDIVDMLLTLKRRDLATCLFNQVFLRDKIKQAKDALDTFQDTTAAAAAASVTHHSRAIPIIAPEEVTTKGSDMDLSEQIDHFLASLKGLPTHEQKQLLGDRLFPLVKATGVKHSPRITIRLLDSVPLTDLAYAMYDKAKLKQHVSQIVSTIQKY